jgi:hypothetical protein
VRTSSLRVERRVWRRGVGVTRGGGGGGGSTRGGGGSPGGVSAAPEVHVPVLVDLDGQTQVGAQRRCH